VVTASNDAGRRPVEPWEQPYLTELGLALRQLRVAASVSQAALAAAIGLSERSIRRLETGGRRTRQSTLARVAVAVAHRLDQPAAASVLLSALVLIAGPALAPESAHAARVDGRRGRRTRRDARRPVTVHNVRREHREDGTVVEHHRHRRWTSRSSVRETKYVRVRGRSRRPGADTSPSVEAGKHE
jgi:transcriptional regulator with XRE-family HTH domain